MRIARILVLAAVASSAALFSLGIASGRPDSPAAVSKHADDEQAIRLVFEKMTAAWARGDGAGFAQAFSPDARFVNIQGLILSGSEEIGRHHTALFAGPYKGTRATIAASDIRFLRPDVAIVAVSGALVPPKGADAEAAAAMARAEFVVTCTLARSDRGWAIESFQNTMKPPPDAPPRQP